MVTEKSTQKMTRAELLAKLEVAEVQMQALRMTSWEALDELRELAGLLAEFMRHYDRAYRFMPEEVTQIGEAKMRLLSICKAWFTNHSVSSSDQISQAARALLLAAGEQDWLYTAQSQHEQPGIVPRDEGRKHGASRSD